MATAAPAPAPAAQGGGSAPVGSPSPKPAAAPHSSTPANAPAPASDSEGQGAAPRSLRPIKGKPPIPGLRHFTPAPDPVVPDVVQGVRDEGAGEGQPQEPASPNARPQQAEAPVQPKQDTPTRTVINLRGKDYTAADIERALETQRMRIKANEADAEAWRKHVQSQGQRPGETRDQRDPNWRNRPDLNNPSPAQRAQGQQGQQPNQDGTQPGQEGQQKPADFVTAVGEEFWAQLPEIAKQHGVQTAMALMAQKMDQHQQKQTADLSKSIRAEIMKELTPQLKTLQPIVESHVLNQNQNVAKQRFRELAQTAGDDGQPLFDGEFSTDPELQDMAGLLWVELGNRYGQEFADSDYAHWCAVRDAMEFKQQHVRKQGAAATTAQQVLDSLEQGQRSGAALASPGPSMPLSPAPDSPHEDAAQLQKRIRSAHTGTVKSSTGFDFGVKKFQARDED